MIPMPQGVDPNTEQPIILDDKTARQVMDAIIETRYRGETLEFVICVYDEELYQRDVSDGHEVERCFPSIRRGFAEHGCSPYNITKEFGYDAVMNGKNVIITELHIPSHSRFIPPNKYIYEDGKDPILFDVDPNIAPEETPIVDPVVTANLKPEDKVFVTNVFKQSAQDNLPPSQKPPEQASPNMYDKYGITEQEYWRREREFLANEDEDFPYFVASLLNTYGMDDVVLDECPGTSAYDLLFCHLIKATKQQSSVTFLPTIHDLYGKGFISCPFGANVFTRALTSKNCWKILEQLLAITIQPFLKIDKEFAVDSSGFTTVAYSQWFKTKYTIVSKESVTMKEFVREDNSKRRRYSSRQAEKTAEIKAKLQIEKEYERKPWLKTSIMVGRITHAVFGLDITSSHGEGSGDSSRFKKVVKEAAKYFDTENAVVTADKIYNVAPVYKTVDEYGFHFVCDFKKKTKGTTKCDAMNKAYHFKLAHPDIFNYFYGGRNNVESVFANIKNKVGERIFANSDEAIYNEMYIKVIAYNIIALIRLYYMCGIKIELNELPADAL